MRRDVHSGMDPVLREKMTKNVVYLGMISVFMAFAGLSSAYIVSSGDAFWLKFPMPSAFWISTVIIVISSVVFQLSVAYMKKGNTSLSKILVVTTTVLGICFAYSQYKGYQQMVKNGAYFVSRVVVSEGRYGDYFEVKMNGDFIDVDGNEYLKKGKKLSATEKAALQNYLKNFMHAAKTIPSSIDTKGNEFVLLYQAEPLTITGSKLQLPNGTALQRADLIRLEDFSKNIIAGRGDFFISGEMGKDFKIYYHGDELIYKDRMMYYKGKPLTKPLELKLFSTKDNATSYLYIITFLHLLHVIGMLIYMLFFTKRTLQNEFSANNTAAMSSAALFWHFLGALWIYLLLFLLFIH
jgi:cytochrome c oxidase subunit 3